MTSRLDGLADDAGNPDPTAGPHGPGDPDRRPAPAPREPRQRWRLVLRRASLDAGPAHKAWQSDLLRSLAAAGLPIAGMDAEPPRPKVVLAAPLPAGIPGEAELVDMLLVERRPAWQVREAVDSALAPGDALVACFDVWLGAPPLPGQVAASVYRIVVGIPGSSADPETVRARLRDVSAAMLAAPALPRMRRKGETQVPYELRPFLGGLEVEPRPVGSDVAVRAVLLHDPEKGIGRPEEIVAELADRMGSPLEVRSIVRERLVLAEELPSPAGAQPGTADGRAGTAAGRHAPTRRPGTRRAPDLGRPRPR